ncbi:response regulator [Neolewinella aurantiaca]|uniref:histidine kinase n=1 Tax=Neolewinella aurantiaca TaxID=2602767 RepID=A0A5C7F7K4_9BACT|nr:hybrid sensor histidine kinase/response regulator transcription factor [Neolewinella aurantiaca]TXF86672.1 response regulator [Neolewinella aurantiaca]
MLVFWCVLGAAAGAGQCLLKPGEQLTISEGLSHNGVSSILTDSRGYLWVATFDGLNRYNGNSVTVFQNLPGKKLLVSNRIRSLVEDQKGNLVLGTDEGLSVYHYEEDRFETIYTNERQKKGITGPIIRKILLLPTSGTILAVTDESGILVFDKEYNFLKQCIPTGLASGSPLRYLSGDILNDALALIATNNGLLLFDVETGHFDEVLPDVFTSSLCAVKVDGQHLLVGTSAGVHLVKYSLSGETGFKWERSLFSGDAYPELAVDNRRNLWMGTLLHGVTKVSTVDALIEGGETFVARFATNGGLLRSSGFAPMGDDEIWVGSFDKGAFRFDLEAGPFYSSLDDRGDGKGTYLNNVSFTTPIDRQRVLINGTGGPVRLFNTQTKAYEPLPEPIAGVSGVLQYVYLDSQGNYWYKIVNENRLLRVGKGNSAMYETKFSDLGIPGDYHFFQLKEDRAGNIWIAFQEDLYRAVMNENREIQDVQRLSDNPEIQARPIARIRTLYVDPLEDIIWMGTNSNGLYSIPTKPDQPLKAVQIDNYLNVVGEPGSLTSNFVSSIIRLNNGELWVGTEQGGVCKFNGKEARPQFTSFTTKNGLTNNVVKSLLSDDSSNLWIGTNAGLNKLEPKSDKIVTYRVEDGLPFDDFYYSAVRMGDGKLLFSGVRGFTFFRPENIPAPKQAGRVQFGSLKLLNKTIGVGDTVKDRVLLPQRLKSGAEIELDYDENVFSIEIDALHFGAPGSYYLSYKLLPDNNGWLKLLPGQRALNFNNLSPGKYNLLVRSCKVGGECSSVGSLRLQVAPPWWRSVLAYALYAFLFLLLGVVILYSVVRFQKLRHAVEIEQLERNAAKKINAEKLRFFSNISHEIKTPVSLIYGPVQLLLRRFAQDKPTSESLQLIERQARKISRLVDQVQDFQKADANLLELYPQVFVLEDFLTEIIQDLRFLAKSEGKTIEVRVPEHKIYVDADKDKLEKIIDNLLSNALKHTVAGDEIEVVVTHDGFNLNLAIADTGTGIPAASLPYVFDRFYQVDNQKYNATTGSGIGLAFTKRLVELHGGKVTIQSEVDQGTRVVVELPVVRPAASAEFEDGRIRQPGRGNASALVRTDPAAGDNIELAEEYRGKRIFLAEDNLEMREFVRDFLSKYFKVTSFTTGRECLTAMEEEWPDLVVSDVQMPDMNGLELCSAIKGDLKTSHIPVVLLTAFNEDDDRIKGVKYGADSYIGKPFGLQLLVSTIENLLKNRVQLLERFKVDFPLTLEKESAQDHEFLEGLYELMVINLDNTSPDLDSFARKLLLNRTHFYQKVKQMTGLTPYELLKSFRLKRAAELLVHDGLTVNEVYVATGFKSRSNFSKAFKRKYGTPPSQYAAKSEERLVNNS